MTDLIRVINIPWFLVLFFFWAIRFKEPGTDRLKTACQRRSAGWYFNHVAELLGVGYLLGLGFGYFAKSGNWMGWAGEDDLRLPGWGWVIGLGFGLFNFFVQHFSRDGRASKLATAAVVSAAVFFNITAILHWRDQGFELIDARVIIALLIVGGLIIATVITTIVEVYMPGDFAVSASLPFSFLFLIYGVKAYPVPDQTEFLVAIITGTGLIPIRIYVMHWLLKPETKWCIKSNLDSNDRQDELEKRLDKLSKKSKKKTKTLTEEFDDAYTAAKSRAVTSWQHRRPAAWETAEEEETEEEEEADRYSEGGESLHWDQVKVTDPFE